MSESVALHELATNSLFDSPSSLPRVDKFSGDFVERVTPVPIPNTEVKPLGADGTARVAAWESRKSPGLIQKPARAVLFSRAFPF